MRKGKDRLATSVNDLASSLESALAEIGLVSREAPHPWEISTAQVAKKTGIPLSTVEKKFRKSNKPRRKIGQTYFYDMR